MLELFLLVTFFGLGLMLTSKTGGPFTPSLYITYFNFISSFHITYSNFVCSSYITQFSFISSLHITYHNFNTNAL